jgi:pimeloyl-ACP methyl ester carboxylesterase
MSTVKVPGATIYYEERGVGPALVMIPGGPTDAGVFTGLAAALADRYRTVSYDPRGNSRSVFDVEPVDQDMNVHADDAAHLIDALGSDPVFVLGSSGGAQIGLALVARHPDRVRALVAHEPPCVMMLPDRDAILRAFDEVNACFQREGAQPAMDGFAKLAGFDRPPPAAALPPEAMAPEIVATFARIAGNLDYFLAHGVKQIASYRPDVAALRSSRVIVGVGRDSTGQLANRSARALAAELAIEPVVFPGDHTGFGPHAVAFADVLERVLAT